VRKDPPTHREVLVILENLYDLVLRVEQLRRDQPLQEEEEAFIAWCVPRLSKVSYWLLMEA
jgi:DNA topoisomerase 2-associated protein PAT1